MRRLPATGASALIVALAAGILSLPPTTTAASSCTGWDSTLVPPPTIRVLRTALGRVETVPFRRYVEVVLAAEWGPSHPSEALAAGAVAVKQYAWYHALAGNWRGGRAGGRCFDVRDTNVDQVYRPGSKVPTPKHKAAVTESWAVSLRKVDAGHPNGRFFMTSYNGGHAYARCGAGVTGRKLWQLGASACAKAGYTYESILRIYYGPYLRVVTAPARVKRSTDIGLFIDRDVAGSDGALVLSSDGRRLQATSDGTLRRALAGMVEHVVADLDGDGRNDVAALIDGPGGALVRVVRATKDGAIHPETWWEASEQGPDLAADELQLVAADWHATGHPGLGLVAPVAGEHERARLYELQPRNDGGPAALRELWEGDLDVAGATVVGGDFTGDGRADLAAVTTERGGVALLVVASRSTGHGFHKAKRWGLEAAPTPRTVLPLAGDLDGDGRDDIMLLSPSGDDGLSVRLFRARAGSFVRTSPLTTDRGFSWPRLEAGAADLDRDGRTDLFVFSDVADGSVIHALYSDGASLRDAEWVEALHLTWAAEDAH